VKPDVSNLTKKERKEFLREYRSSQEKKGRLQSSLIKVIVVLVILSIVGGVAFLLSRPPAPEVQIGEKVEEQGRNHITQGASSKFSYNTNPPTSGPHWPQQAECKIYDEEIADESALHSLEHGAVWLSYKDKNDKDLVNKLTEIVKSSPGKVLLSPRGKNDSKIAVAAWTRLLKQESLDEKQIKDFIKNYRNQSPEPLAQC